MAITLLYLPLILLCSLFSPTTAAADTISHGQSITDGETLLSPNGQFALGFFSPTSNSSALRYLGIWYTFSNQTVVWVANRRNPIPDSSGVLTLTANGTLVLVYQTNVTAWTSATTSKVATVPKARLSNSGNLVATDGSGATTWQSFDHPTDTMLPGMKVGLDLQTGNNWSLTSWKSPDDPSPGDYVYGLNTASGSYEIYISRTGTNSIKYRPGRWDGIFLSGVPHSMAYIDLFDYIFVPNEDEAYYSYRVKDASTVARLVLSWSGRIGRFVWVRETGTWTTLLQSPVDNCSPYGTCGPNGVCSAAGLCDCYVGYAPMKPDLWRVKQYENGCEREERELCGVGEGFRVVTRVKLPDTKNANVDYGKSLDECREWCLRNCKCNAYAAANISGVGEGTGCIVWTGELVDGRRFTVDGQELYLRVAASKLPDSLNQTKTIQEHKKRKATTIFIAVPLVTTLVFAILGALIWYKRRNKYRSSGKGKKMSDVVDNCKIWDGELQSFDLAAIASMTDNFANENKIGEGGFGSVYKGRIRNEQEVAVKRQSVVSRQGLDEFMNEVVLIGKLQHRNLVRLLGCCITKEERILVYEYMSNKSLDTFLYGKMSREMLDWRKRVDIIMGIARGLIYLHQDSRFRIIHRDLKAGNILLDEEMNPRISDFGTARLFRGDELKESARTKRVIGTYGYMSPEYAMDGIYSVKSDVFSFGVLVLEIISGRKNSALCEENWDLNLLALAWRLWKEDRALELLDGTLTSSCSAAEVLRHIQIALLCIQEFAEDRPTMSTVAFMLSNVSSPLPQPRRPGFCKTRITAGLQFERESRYTINEITLTNVEGR